MLGNLEGGGMELAGGAVGRAGVIAGGAVVSDRDESPIRSSSLPTPSVAECVVNRAIRRAPSSGMPPAGAPI